MCRTGLCRFGIGNWIFLLATLHLFTFAQGGDEASDEGVQLTMEPADALVPPGARVTLPCAARAPAGQGAPPPRLAWRHSAAGQPTRDHTIGHDDRYRKQLPNGSLVIEAMSATLAGRYQCVASADGVGTVVSRVAAVALAELPEVTGGPRSVLAVAGGPVVIPCGLRPRDPLHALLVLPAPPTGPHRSVGSKERAPPPALAVNVTWLKNGQPLRTEWARVALAASGALELDPARPHDAGSYRCRASLPHQPHLYATSEETELRVSVESAGAEYPPRFIATPQSVTVMEGASVTFDCAAVGNPKPEMIWLNNGAAIDLSDLDSRFYLAGSGSLRVAGARAGDSGAYTCRAHNRLDHADHTAQLHVLTAPRVSLPGGGAVVARERGDVTLRCVARGQPAPRVAWLKDGEPLSPNNHDIALVDGYSLRIQGVLRVDAGMFQCAASSPAGSAQAALRLTVLQPEDDPPPPAKPVSSAVDILNSLISSERADGPPSDEDYLGETSSSFTPEPEFSDYYDEEEEEGGPAGLELAGGEGGSSGSAGPPAPMDLRAVLVKHRFVTLSWQPPEGEAQLDGYAVVYRVKGSQRERVSRGPASRTEMNVAGLQPNTTYQFAVRAYAGGGISPPTETIEVTTPEEEASLGPPLNVRAEPMGPHTARVSWAPPAIGPPPDNYTVHYTEAETGREQLQWVSAPPGGASVSTTLSGLRAAALYWVRVAAAGGAPAELRLRTPSDAPAAPPTNVSAVGTGATSIVVRWEPPPPRTHRGPLTGYKVRYRPAPAQPPAAAPRRKADSLTTPADARRAELTGLDTGTTYQIRVCAINANGSGPFSEWLTASTQPRPLDETRVPPQPPPLTTRAGRDWISVWWAEEGEGFGTLVRGYWLGWGLGVPDEHSRELPSHLHSHVIRGLESNAEYVISLRASNALGLGPAVYATVRTKPAAAEVDDEDDGDDADTDADDDDEDDDDTTPPLIPPVGLKVIMLSGTTAVVYWTDPTLPKGQTATDGRRYVVRWSAPGGRARAYNASDLSCMLDDLRPHTTYEFAVKLIKGGRESAWSLLVSNTTLEAAPGSAPRDLRVAPPQPASAAARAADLAWAPPAKPNGLVTGYVIMYAVQRGGGAEEWTAVAVLGERTRARVDRLRPRTAYLFKVQARNSKGLGPFSQPVAYTTAMEAGEGGGLASATSAWLWASAGGACAVLALAAALALSLCCRRAPQHLSPDTSTYQKSSASAAIKPPDLWIHHDQMELKHMDKSLHSSNMSVEGGLGGGLASSSLTLGRGAEYEPARHPSHHAPHPHPLPHPHPPASLDRRHYVPTYVESSRASCAGSSDESAPRASPASTAGGCYRCDYRPMTGVGVGVGGMGAPCGGTCERRQHRALPHHPDQSTPLLSGVAPLGSPQSSLASLAPLHPPPAPCGSGSCPLGAACSAPGPPGVAGGPGGGGGAPTPGGDIYACAARERGHYVAYEPLGHYTHRDSLSSEPGPAGGAGSLQRRAGAGPPPVGVGVGVGVGSALHSFSDGSDHSTPTHSNRSVRESSPYKKSASSSPGHAPNRLQLGGAVAHCSEELEPLTPSRSTERLQREMQNLEGLMKDLSAITQQQFHC